MLLLLLLRYSGSDFLPIIYYNCSIINSLKLPFISLCSKSINQDFEQGSVGRFCSLMGHQLGSLGNIQLVTSLVWRSPKSSLTCLGSRPGLPEGGTKLGHSLSTEFQGLSTWSYRSGVQTSSMVAQDSNTKGTLSILTTADIILLKALWNPCTSNYIPLPKALQGRSFSTVGSLRGSCGTMPL